MHTCTDVGEDKNNLLTIVGFFKIIYVKKLLIKTDRWTDVAVNRKYAVNYL
jgi:hypothetical protein